LRLGYPLADAGQFDIEGVEGEEMVARRLQHQQTGPVSVLVAGFDEFRHVAVARRPNPCPSCRHSGALVGHNHAV
jgi:hypothetical protein